MNLLDQYKTAWQDEPAFHVPSLNNQEIRAYLEKRSARMDRMYRSGILFDLVVKTILLCLVAGLVTIFQLSTGSILVSAAAGASLAGSLLFDERSTCRFPVFSHLQHPSERHCVKESHFSTMPT